MRVGGSRGEWSGVCGTEGEDTLEDVNVGGQVLLREARRVRNSETAAAAQMVVTEAKLTSSTATIRAFASPGSSP